MGSWHLCRRHARLVRILTPAEFQAQLPPPDLDNRAPSLASYLGEALDAPMRKLMNEVCRPENGEHVTAEALTCVTSQNGEHRWAQRWKVFDNTGPLLRIAVEVDEESEPECIIRLDSRVVLRFVPPWITAHMSGAPFVVEEDTEKRLQQMFFSTLMDRHIRPAVIAEERWIRRWERSSPRVLARV
jgi:hypothetical protein